MKKIIFLLVICLLSLSLTSCQKGKAIFKVDNAYYKLSNDGNKVVEDNDTLFLDHISEQIVRLNVVFEYKVKSRNVNNLPEVKVDILNITYVVKLNGEEILSTKTNSSTHQENAVYNFNEGNIHSIKNTSMIRVPVLESGKYEVTCYANYYLKDKLLTKPITFTFTVK